MAEENKKNGEPSVQISEGNKQYITTDIALAATLMTIGRKLISTGVRRERVGGRSFKKTEFIFEGADIEKVKVNFTNKELQVDARTVLDNLRTLKGISYGRGR